MPQQLPAWSDTIERTYPQVLPKPLRKVDIASSPLHRVSSESLEQLGKISELPIRLSNLLRGQNNADKRPSVEKPTAAVLVPLLLPTTSAPLGELRVLLTKRTSNLSQHKGELAFPGGKLEPGETYCEAAVRETKEETGISDVNILGTLGSRTTVFNTSFVSVVGVVEDIGGLSLSPKEVEKVLLPSVDELLRFGNHHEEKWWFSANTPPRTMHFFAVDEELCWGATASVLAQLLELIAQI